MLPVFLVVEVYLEPRECNLGIREHSNTARLLCECESITGWWATPLAPNACFEDGVILRTVFSAK